MLRILSCGRRVVTLSTGLPVNPSVPFYLYFKWAEVRSISL